MVATASLCLSSSASFSSEGKNTLRRKGLNDSRLLLTGGFTRGKQRWMTRMTPRTVTLVWPQTTLADEGRLSRAGTNIGQSPAFALVLRFVSVKGSSTRRYGGGGGSPNGYLLTGKDYRLRGSSQKQPSQRILLGKNDYPRKASSVAGIRRHWHQ